jgi:drug/metabolite transporter (DMT)-like permease
MTNQKRAYFFAGLTVLCWSTVATAFKIALSGQNPTNLLFYSTVFSTISLAIIYFSSKTTKVRLSAKAILSSALMGFLNPFLYYIVLFKAYSLLPAQSALTLNYSWAIVIVLFSIIFLKQRISLINIFGLIISFFGVMFIAAKGNLQTLEISDTFGTSLALSTSLIWGAYWILNLKDRRDAKEKLFLNFAFGLLFITIYQLGFNQIELPDFKTLSADVYIGLFEMGITFVLWLNALKYSEDTAKVSNIIYLSPFFSLFFIALILGEKIEFYSIIGLILIIIGILFGNLIKFFKK